MPQPTDRAREPSQIRTQMVKLGNDLQVEIDGVKAECLLKAQEAGWPEQRKGFCPE